MAKRIEDAVYLGNMTVTEALHCYDVDGHVSYASYQLDDGSILEWSNGATIGYTKTEWEKIQEKMSRG